jgi:class 3 adenylate cyclase
MLPHQGKRLQARKLSAELAAMARTKERDDVSSAAAACDTQEQDLITKTRKIIAASNRALREAEATGMVEDGDLIGSDASQEQAIVGETPNLAACLKGIAEPSKQCRHAFGGLCASSGRRLPRPIPAPRAF